MAANAEVVGREWDDGFYTGIRKITLSYCDDAIGSFQVDYYDSKGQVITGNDHHAGHGFPKNGTIPLEGDELIVNVTGNTGPVTNRKVVRSLKFSTNRNRSFEYPPNFKAQIEDTPFKVPIEDKRNVVGFKGVTDGVLIAIGVHSVPLKN